MLFLKMVDGDGGVTGVGIVCICYLEVFKSKRPRNVRANLENGFKTHKWQVLRCFW